LHLHYEQAQTRRVPRRRGWYNLATHFPWIGDRTRDVNGAHVEFFRGIENPIGIKVGPTMSPTELLELVDILNPDNEPGRLTLIHRFGSDSIQACLSPLIDAIESSGRTVVWCCDPMHGNTEVVEGRYKTRDFQRILSELEQAFDLHKSKGTYLGGIHFELTGDDVTECIGGARGLKAKDLGRAYKTQVDPRLNYEQALEMALLVAQRMAQG
jgi:3-deoxy-7-phosphoheptulonate synthase